MTTFADSALSFLDTHPGAANRADAWRASLLVVFIVAFSLIHLLSWALNRYRLPVDAVGLLFAGRAVIALGRRIAPRQPARVAVGT